MEVFHMSENSKRVGEKEVICPKCGHNKSYVNILLPDGNEFGECQQCGKMTYIIYKDNATTGKPIVRCPYCNSGNTRKITKASKAGSVALWGIFALGKTTKQWHCNDCKSDF